jgi:hypothetical protein
VFTIVSPSAIEGKPPLDDQALTVQSFPNFCTPMLQANWATSCVCSRSFQGRPSEKLYRQILNILFSVVNCSSNPRNDWNILLSLCKNKENVQVLRLLSCKYALLTVQFTPGHVDSYYVSLSSCRSRGECSTISAVDNAFYNWLSSSTLYLFYF